MTLELNTLLFGDEDYINKHNENYSEIQSLVNVLEEDISGIKANTFFSTSLDFRLLAQNKILNGAFDFWQRGVNERPDGWKIENSLVVQRSTEQVRTNTFSVKTTGTGQLTQKLLENVRKSLLTTVTYSFGCWVFASADDTARIGIFNGTTTSYSQFHGGQGTWEFLTVNFTTGTSAPSELKFILDNQGGTVYFNAAVLIRGNPQGGPIFIINDPTLEELRILAAYETGQAVVSGVGVNIFGNRELTTRVRFKVPKLEVPTISLVNELDTGFDFSILDVTRCGFSLNIAELGGESGTDGFEINDLLWIAEVSSV